MNFINDDGNKLNATTYTSNGKENPVLHVALQTMKERCQSLQQRLASVEDENLNLRMKIGLDKPTSQLLTKGNSEQNNYDDTGQSTSSSLAELELLRDSVATLTRQKLQLSDHVAMIATENRQLWARLSKLTKDNETLGNSLNKIKDTQMQSISDASTPPGTMLSGSTSPTIVTGHQNLIRSKTFTQNSPNPLLRQKLNYDDLTSPPSTPTMTTTIAENQMNPTLEEISLHVLNEFLNGQAEIEQKCNEITNQSKSICSSTINNNSTPLNFGYLNVDNVIGNGSTTSTTTRHCNAEDMIEDDNTVGDDGNGATKKLFLEQFNDIKKEVLRQQSDLKVALSSLRQRKGTFEICAACKNHPKQTVDKYVSTDNIDMVQNILQSTVNTTTTTTTTTSQSHQQQQQLLHKHKIDDEFIQNPNKYDNVIHLNLNEQKRMADSANKMCPMCGDIYSNLTSFEAFQDHVEAHFVDDSDLDASIEKKYEIVSHSVGNF